MRKPFAAIFVIVAVAALALWYVWQSWQLTDLSSKVIASRLARDELLWQKSRWRLEVAKVWSLAEIERLAKERLGMRKPQLKTLVLPTQK